MTHTSLQDVELGWCGQPSEKAFHRTTWVESQTPSTLPHAVWSTFLLGWAHSCVYSSRGPSQNSPRLSPHHVTLQEGPIWSTDFTGLWSALLLDGHRVRSRDDEDIRSWYLEPQTETHLFVGIRRVAAPPWPSVSSFVEQNVTGSMMSKKAAFYGFMECETVSIVDFHKMMQNSKTGFLDGWELCPVTMPKPLPISKSRTFCGTL